MVLSSSLVAQTNQNLNDIQQKVASIKQRMNLSGEQSDKVGFILEDGMETRKVILKKYGIDLENRNSDSKSKLGFRKMRKLKGELSDEKEKTLSKLSTVLTPEQMEEYQLIQEEMSEKLKARIKESRK